MHLAVAPRAGCLEALELLAEALLEQALQREASAGGGGGGGQLALAVG